MKSRNNIFRRVVAYSIDIFLCFIAILLTQWLFLELKWNPYADQKIIVDRSGLHNWVLFTVTLPIWLYFSLFESGGRRSTGKKMMRLVVVGGGGNAISFARALLRNFVKLIPWEANHLVLFYFGDFGNGAIPGYEYGYVLVSCLTLGYFFCLLFSRKNRAPHDLVVHTEVLEKRSGVY